jgi:prevent-host-death family protein
MHSITIEDAKNQLPNLIEEALRGEDVVLMSSGTPAVRLVPVPPVLHLSKPTFGSARGKITIGDNFDEPLEEFKDYM